MIEKVAEMKTEPVVGKFYLVECARYRGDWIPIVGPKHSDRELGINWDHYHKDIRFIATRDFIDLNDDAGRELNRSLHPDFVEQIALKQRKCVRSMPEFPTDALSSFSKRNKQTFRSFHKEYVGKKVLCGKCPHRGMPLESLPQDENGLVVCNGHGLLIDMKKREVVKR